MTLPKRQGRYAPGVVINQSTPRDRIRREIMCMSCWQINYTTCAGPCYLVLKQSDVYRCPDTAMLFCQSCFISEHVPCGNCNTAGYRHDMVNDDYEGAEVCQSCWRDILAARMFTESETFNLNPSKTFVGLELEYIEGETRHYELSNLGIGEHKDDGSVYGDDDQSGGEFAMYPVNGDELFRRIDRITELMRDDDCYINRTCGLHVHLDVRGLDKVGRKRIFRAFSALEAIFLGMVSSSRLTNEYCRKVEGDWEPSENSRYRTLNWTSIPNHGTLEFRLHQGSLDAKKIKSWVALLLAFVDTFQHVKLLKTEWSKIVHTFSPREKLLFLFQQVKVPISLRKYMLTRLNRFNRFKYEKPIIEGASADGEGSLTENSSN